TIEVGTENLVLAAMRRLDEVDRGRAPRQEGAYGGLTVSRDAVPAVPDAVPGEQREFALNAEELALMSQVDGQRTITRIAINLGRDPDELRVVCERLVRTGVLKLQHRRARTARLVTRLANRRLPPGTVGVDAGILSAWEKALGASVVEVACRRSGGGVTLFPVKALEGIGPYLELTRDALVRADLRVNETLLVRPVTDPTWRAPAGGGVTLGGSRPAGAPNHERPSQHPPRRRPGARSRPPEPRLAAAGVAHAAVPRALGRRLRADGPAGGGGGLRRRPLHRAARQGRARQPLRGPRGVVGQPATRPPAREARGRRQRAPRQDRRPRGAAPAVRAGQRRRPGGELPLPLAQGAPRQAPPAAALLLRAGRLAAEGGRRAAPRHRPPRLPGVRPRRGSGLGPVRHAATA